MTALTGSWLHENVEQSLTEKPHVALLERILALQQRGLLGGLIWNLSFSKALPYRYSSGAAAIVRWVIAISPEDLRWTCYSLDLSCLAAYWSNKYDMCPINLFIICYLHNLLFFSMVLLACHSLSQRKLQYERQELK